MVTKTTTTKKVWIKLTKFFQGGKHIGYMYVDEKSIETESQRQELMENWGENSDGGHAYGYRVEMHELQDEFPPKIWIEKEINSIANSINFYQNSIENLKQLSLEYEEILKKM